MAKTVCPKCGSSDNVRRRDVRAYSCDACRHYFYTQRRNVRRKNFMLVTVDRCGINETNDCMVRAAAVAMQAPYKDVHALFSLAGREDRKGTYIYTSDKAFTLAPELGLPTVKRVSLLSYAEGDGGLIPASSLERSPEEREVIRKTRYGYSTRHYLPKHKSTTLALLQEHLKTGRFIICNHNHAWTVIDGVSLDSNYHSGRTEITQLYEVTK